MMNSLAMKHVEASMDAGPVVHGSIGIGATQTKY
jgi:hypothetical protein